MFCLAVLSAAAIRGRKSPLKPGQQVQPRGAEVTRLLVPCASRAAAEVPWPGQDAGTQPALPRGLCGGESRCRGTDLVTSVSETSSGLGPGRSV